MYKKAGVEEWRVGLNGADDFVFRNTDSKNFLNIADNGDISFYEDTGTTPKLFWDASEEALGIGTTTPSTLIHLERGSTGAGGGSNAGITMTNKFDSPDNSWSITPQRTGVSNTGLQIRDETDSRTDMVFDGSGNVGIGTSSPSDILHIKDASSTNVIIDAPTDNASLTLQCGSSDAGAEGAFINFIQNTTSKWQVGMNTDNTFRWYNYNTSSEAMRIDSLGNVTITGSGTGSTTPLKVNNTDSAAFVHAQQNIAPNLASTNTVVDFVGKELSLKNSGYIGYTWSGAGSNSNRLTFGHYGSDYLMNLTADGNLLINNTGASPLNSGRVRIYNNTAQDAVKTYQATSGTTALWSRIDHTASYFAVFNYNGSTVGTITTNGSATAYNTSSDHRLKENVTADWDATTRLKQLNPVRFNFIADADTTVDGFLAHEVQSVVPEAISGTHNEVDDDGNPVYQGIDQSKLVPLLVKTIQELEARIVALETA
jgi:hypothetical protein